MHGHEIIQGHPVRVYDAPKFRARYTVFFMGWPVPRRARQFQFLESGPDPRGFSGHGEAQIGTHNGKRIPFASLPEAVKAPVLSELTQTNEAQ